MEQRGTAEKRRILCYGDSLTWGWVPMDNAVPTHRYPFEQRWTGVMAAELGDGYEIVEEALSGRTTAVDDPTDPRLNGASYLPSALASHLPLDLVIILLGSNDTEVYFDRTVNSSFCVLSSIRPSPSRYGVVHVRVSGKGVYKKPARCDGPGHPRGEPRPISCVDPPSRAATRKRVGILRGSGLPFNRPMRVASPGSIIRSQVKA